MAKPGNIDIRYGFSLGGESVDVVACLQRGRGHRITVFAVDRRSRKLRRLDDGTILTGAGKGGTLYFNRSSNRLYFIKTAQDEGGVVEQYEMVAGGKGRVLGRKVRQWDQTGCEAAVADDERRLLYLAEEERGIWEVGAEPHDPTPGRLVVRVGEHGLAADVEGLAIYKTGSTAGYLIVANQSRNQFHLYELGRSHRFVGRFTIAHVNDPDGIEVSNLSLGPELQGGMFLTHSEGPAGVCPVLATPWSRISEELALGAWDSNTPRIHRVEPRR